MLKRYTIWGIIFVTIFGSISHFIYEWSGNNFLAGLFFPVDESTWEHLKLLFFPMLFYSFYAVIKLKHSFPDITSSLCFGMLSGTLLIPVIFYSYTFLLGYHTLALDIATFVISVILAFIIVYTCTLHCNLQKYQLFLKICVAISALAFMSVTCWKIY